MTYLKWKITKALITVEETVIFQKQGACNLVTRSGTSMLKNAISLVDWYLSFRWTDFNYLLAYLKDMRFENKNRSNQTKHIK